MLPASFFDLVGQKSWLPAGPPAESLHEEDGPTQCTLAMGQAPIALQFQAPPPLRAETGSSPRQSEASPSECPGDLADHVASVPLPLHGASAQDDLEQPQETGGHEALVGAAAPLLPALSDGGDGVLTTCSVVQPLLRESTSPPLLSGVLHTDMEQRCAPEDHGAAAGSQPSLQAAGSMCFGRV
jgi:hypothetical protein